MSPHDQPDIDPVLADAVRRAFVRPLDEGTATRHVSAIAAAARAGGEPVVRRPRLRRRMWRSALAAAAATLLLPVGLAVAGVSLPDAVERPYRAIGITLPHQAGQAEPAPAMRPVTPRTQTTTPKAGEPPRPAEHRSRRGQADQGQGERPKRRADPSDPAGPRDKARGSSARPSPLPKDGAKQPGLGPRRPTDPRRKPASPKASVGAKQRAEGLKTR